MSNIIFKIAIIVILVIIFPVKGNCQLGVNEDVSLVPIAGDLEFVNIGEPDEEIIYSNPEGNTELEISHKGMIIHISAGDEIRFASGAGILSATGGVKFTDGESVAEGGWVWYNLYERYGEFHGNPIFEKPVDAAHVNHFECESMEIKVGDKGLSGSKFYKVRNTRLYLKKEDLAKIKGEISPKDSGNEEKKETPQKTGVQKKQYLLENDNSGKKVKDSESNQDEPVIQPENTLNRKIAN